MLAEGLAVTVAATVATAPLIAFHFETLSTTTLLANVLAMPAVAPAMWLGMCSAGLAQIPGLPLEPLNGLNALLLAYVAQVASWCSAPDWAEVHVHLGGAGLVAGYLGIFALALGALYLRRLRLLRPALGWPAAAAAVLVALGLAWPLSLRGLLKPAAATAGGGMTAGGGGLQAQRISPKIESIYLDVYNASSRVKLGFAIGVAAED